MHVSAWGMWAVWGMAMSLSIVWSARKLAKIDRVGLPISIAGLLISILIALGYSQAIHGPRPFLEMTINLLAWGPILLIAWTSIAEILFGKGPSRKV